MGVFRSGTLESLVHTGVFHSRTLENLVHTGVFRSGTLEIFVHTGVFCSGTLEIFVHPGVFCSHTLEKLNFRRKFGLAPLIFTPCTGTARIFLLNAQVQFVATNEKM